MGYTTDFYGKLNLDPPLNAVQIAYLQAFNETRRMARDEAQAALLPDPKRQAVGLPLGQDGEYFVGGGGWAGQDRDNSIANYNNPPASQPGLWCQWTVSDNGKKLEWDGGEKFYEYTSWLEYVNDHFLKPWGIKMDGDIRWRGEDSSDRGFISVNNNKIVTLEGAEYAAHKAVLSKIKAAQKQKKVLQEVLEEKLPDLPASPKPKI